MSWLSSWLHPDRGYKKAQEEMKKYYEQALGFQQPYNQNGQQQGGILGNAINELMDPQALQDKWSNGYKESDYAKNMENLAQQHGINSASSLGLGGSNTALNAIQSGTAGIMAQDKQNYLNNLMEKYKLGTGLSQNIYNTGAGTAGQMGQNAMNMGDKMGQLKFGETNAQGAKFGEIAGMIAKSIASAMSGGGFDFLPSADFGVGGG